jgi:uncharacterized YigZ family protein
MKSASHISYYIPITSTCTEETIKRSRFIVQIAHTPDIQAAKSFIAKTRVHHASANHNCWAYVAGAPNCSHVLGFSDDGEPGGTAGKPMLNVLMGSEIGEITAVVTRYFGGIKLGTGGLMRAYSGCLNRALHNIKTVEKIPKTMIIAKSDYANQMTIDQVLKEYNTLDVTKSFTDHIRWVVKMDSRVVESCIGEVFDRTNGQVKFEQEDAAAPAQN